MSAYCSRCPGPLDQTAILTGFDFCTDCERRDLDHAIKLKDRGQQLASDAHPDDHAKVEAAIRKFAATGKEFSANECRALHGVAGPVVGAAFTAARKAGVIRAVGYTTSTDPGTHAHPVRTWIGAAA